MFHPDTEANRQLVREHQAELKRDWQWVSPGKPEVVASRSRRHRRGRLYWLRTLLRPANRAGASSGSTPAPRWDAHGRRIEAGNPRQVVECLILPRADRPTAERWLERKGET